MITKTFKLTVATDTEEQMQKEEEYLSMIYGAEEIEKDDTRRNDMEWDDEYEDFEDEEYENLTADVDMIPAMQAYNKTCNLCGKMYEQYTVPQKLGFKVKEYDICPYCQGSNGESMSVEFFNSP